ncbi:MAG TPA: hypothetical protein VL307_17435 [Chitinophagaceae bacterium]|nr:hypothetical protein [Chitinophagaceae bacterium]
MKKYLLAATFVSFLLPALAQHEHHMMQDSTTKKSASTDTMPSGAHAAMSHKMGEPSMMSHSFSKNLPMNRNGSGTGWLPDASPMYGYMQHAGPWMFMLHGNLFLRYNKQDVGNKGSRGSEKWDAPDWLMFMGQRAVGKRGLFHFSSMLSLDALTGSNGYPLLFQSGEAYKGQPIVDRQHPHDLFAELSVSYAHALSANTDVFVYVGYPGEPALGPVAFMHRPSALNNPDAPLSHHWSDATHISFGVATLGIRYKNLKLETSSFTGREPDDQRYNFDKPRFDSRSARLSFNPSAHWALQASYGFIKSPEQLHPDEDVHRTTASASYSTTTSGGYLVNSTVLWGMNKTAQHSAEHAALAELAVAKKRLALYTRYEWVQKSAEELNLDEAVYGHDNIYPVNAFTLGFNYDLLHIGKTRLAAGSQGSLYLSPSTLYPSYGKRPMALEIFIRFYPGQMMMKM